MKSNRREFAKHLGSVAAASSIGLHSSTFGQGISVEDYMHHDALGLAEMVRRTEVSPGDLLNSALERAAVVDSTINALIDDPKLLAQARDNALKDRFDGPFHGVPFLVKDLGFPMQGVEMWLGSSLFRGWKPEEDSGIVTSFRQAGLNIFGRTTTPELGIVFTTESQLTGATRNPWDTNFSAGGSSGGSAAAVAAGIVPMASGGDGGGSIRVPASCCGLFGFKPTRELVPAGREDYGNIISLHALTRTVRDSAALLDQTARTPLGSPISPPTHQGSYLKSLRVPPKKLKIGSVNAAALASEIDQTCKDAVLLAGNLCRDNDHEVEDVTDTYVNLFDWNQLLDAQVTVFLAGMTLNIENRLAELGRELQPKDLEPTAHDLFKRGKELRASTLAAARQTMHTTALEMAQFQRRRGLDAILTPTLSRPPARIGVLNPSSDKFDLRQAVEYGPFTFIANFTGQPAMSVPIYRTDDAKPLPVGVQFIGRYGEDVVLLQLAAQLEQTEYWIDQRATI